MEKKRFFCIDAHTCGNPVRVVAGGGPPLEGQNMMEKRLHFLKHYDWIRKSLMFEPRGHDMMSGSILYPPTDPANDAAILFIETSGCLPMCGHGTIGTVTVAIEEGLIIPNEPGRLKLETPAGLVKVSYTMKGNKVTAVKLINVPSFLYKEHLKVECEKFGTLYTDVAYGGNFYAIIDPQENFEGIQNYTTDIIIAASRQIRTYLNEHYSFIHPELPEVNYCSHVMWTGTCLHESSTARNAVFYGDKAIDRSPCGTGTSARMAQWYSKKKLLPGQIFIHESYIGSTFRGTIESEVKIDTFNGIIPGIEGWAKIYGYNNILVDADDDPYASGFQVI